MLTVASEVKTPVAEAEYQTSGMWMAFPVAGRPSTHIVGRGENAVRQILDGEVAIAVVGNEALHFGGRTAGCGVQEKGQ